MMLTWLLWRFLWWAAWIGDCPSCHKHDHDRCVTWMCYCATRTRKLQHEDETHPHMKTPALAGKRWLP